MCMTTPACYKAALEHHVQLLPDEQAALQLLHLQPSTIDAVVVFPRAAAAAAAAGAAATAGQAAADAGKSDCFGRVRCNSSGTGGFGGNRQELHLLLEYSIRMNHTQVPLSTALFDTMSVSPGTVDNPWTMLR